MGGKTKKARVNLTLSPAVYVEARHVFDVLDLNMSAFVEASLVQFLDVMRPVMPQVEGLKAGNSDANAAKAAMRLFLAHSQAKVGAQLSELGKLTSELAELSQEEVHTDKK